MVAGDPVSIRALTWQPSNSTLAYVTVYAKIGHMLGKMFFEFLMHTGRFTPFAPSWKVLSGLAA